MALKASKKTLFQFQKKIKSLESPRQEDIESVLIYFLNKNWKKHINLKDNERLNLSHEASWVLYNDINLGLWRQFLKESSSDEYLVIIWKLILKINENSIARGLGVSPGTVFT